ncbi:MAG TPA: corrinoid protein [Candidatus Ventrousia excrementavium]|uniref:Corrinoid protein n=1 Tax=Candidatus Ventrousia excrementavium TaxID=2840961 RepID=A0A9D1IWR2_9CLOT|nr:corrinoid protein [Candidatus Ventrousia excrementavium]
MSADKEKLLAELDRCVLEMEDEAVTGVAQEYVNNGYNAYEGIVNGLSRGMEKAGELYEQEEYFVPELLICSDAMYNGLDVLRPHLPKDASRGSVAVVIGVVQGDTHDIGKNLVKIMLEAAGFQVYDLGRDVEPRAFVEKAKEVGARIICLSTLMTTTMHNMKAVVDLLREEGLQDQIKVMIGGGPVSQAYAAQIGADAYTTDAAAAAGWAKGMVAASQKE